MSIDDTDRRILRLLQRDARLTVAEIADDVGLSPSACHRRVKRLEERGVVRGYAAVLDRRAVGLHVQAYVFVGMEQHSDETLERFLSTISRIDEVVACHAVSGTGDYMLKVLCADMDAFADVALKTIARLPGVKEIQSTFVLATEKEETRWGLPGA